jgi:2-keto-4-pentenoate hydratase/2-oxohepta-3-ene-1,7-dioic acid hydratase in catechol pathway
MEGALKLVSFRYGEAEAVGVLLDAREEVLDLTAAGIAADMQDLIERYDSIRSDIQRLISSGSSGPKLAEIQLIAPLPRPRRNVFCVGKNYFEHAAEFGSSGFDSGSKGGDEVPEYPIFFSKPGSAVIGPGEAIQSSLDPYHSVDYEAELGVVIGRAGRVGDDADPMDFVFGYTAVNDVTSRELQKRHKQWLLGKGIDTFCPMGPAIVPRDEMADLASLSIRCFVNDELRQSARFGDLIFDVPNLVRTLGRTTTLQPGDIIATGTPVGVGIGFKPPRYLHPGDRVRVEIERVGVLENPVV